jgi:hypothetical protein
MDTQQIVVGPNGTAERIKAKCDEIARMLISKNDSYGDSALHPVCIFGRGKATDQIRARIDDKLSRIKYRPQAFGEDVIKDLQGYLVMLTLAMEDEAAAGTHKA